MDEREKEELNRQKKLVDCVSYLNYALEAFSRLEKYQEGIIPILDGFDLTHPDTYLKLTDDIKRELMYIKLFSGYAASQLVKYRKFTSSEEDINSIQRNKARNKEEVENSVEYGRKIRQTLDNTQQKLNELLEKQEKSNTSKVNLIGPDSIKKQLDLASQKKQEKEIIRNKRIAAIESRILRLEWAIFFIFLLQVAILIKIV